ncbi:bis(5'-nucleosyl)-tetraphosphatase PrpE [Anaerobacillus alkaliphilus]|uniref:Bis(5'-nucleosyl)-tetraphosphatase PrpE n=1 Tax=Anaerobacillus alkaliphilus TaxID=1548597 RepID=A0A4Q0VP61_9BACI|nr:bis(5'-nucleosyl)-tetraphosphatase PrpE [Anaerobacillus alkaliphilus]RXI98226.1 bis(5'-nucleosyl)-tetraphosphatase PrpE [Anaerobacillus alkaliphilus]
MYDVIGDIHGCYDEFVELTKTLGYDWSNGFPVHPNGRKLAFVGDLTDRGPSSIKVIEIISTIVKKDLALYTPGNHCDKLYRYFLGRKVQETHGLETTVAELKALSKEKYGKIRSMYMELYENAPLYLTLDEKKLVIAHAGIRSDYIGRTDNKVKTFVLYGDITGEKHPDGSPIRRDWAKKYTEKNSFIVYGHTPVKEPRMINHTINIDTGCVFGGKLTAFRYPEKETVSIDSRQPYVQEKFRDFED